MNTIILGNLEVQARDLPEKMTYEEVVDYCKKEDNYWRLPTRNEMWFLNEYFHKIKVLGFKDAYYRIYENPFNSKDSKEWDSEIEGMTYYEYISDLYFIMDLSDNDDLGLAVSAEMDGEKYSIRLIRSIDGKAPYDTNHYYTTS
jgi:hypothetical protein